MAIEPRLRVSDGLSPPSAPPMRTSFQASATPRQLAPKMSMPARLAHRTDLAGVMHGDLLGDDEDLLSSGFTRMSSATPSRAAGGRYTTPQLRRWPASEAFALRC